ncbi:MAG TPA: ubiquinol-cytochrome C chaperone family protein [Rhizomicrobium sp.]|nr:ubiquinol-cytochrome C chaperone family protein [Rhizomicrobium sp.]
MIDALKRRRRRNEMASRLCMAVSQRAREAAFYRQYGVADTIDGRFDLVALHAWPVLECLLESGEKVLAQGFVDALFARFEDALREQGAGDIGMSRRMTKMASAFYGRLRAYSESVDEAQLAAAILRNVYRGESGRVDRAASLAKYIDVVRRDIAGAGLASGELQFGPIPAP